MTDFNRRLEREIPRLRRYTRALNRDRRCLVVAHASSPTNRMTSRSECSGRNDPLAPVARARSAAQVAGCGGKAAYYCRRAPPGAHSARRLTRTSLEIS